MTSAVLPINTATVAIPTKQVVKDNTKPVIQTNNKISLIFLINGFNEKINGDSDSCFCISLAKKVLNIAFLIIVPLNILLMPFIFAYNCCLPASPKIKTTPEVPIPTNTTTAAATTTAGTTTAATTTAATTTAATTTAATTTAATTTL